MHTTRSRDPPWIIQREDIGCCCYSACQPPSHRCPGTVGLNHYPPSRNDCTHQPPVPHHPVGLNGDPSSPGESAPALDFHISTLRFSRTPPRSHSRLRQPRGYLMVHRCTATQWDSMDVHRVTMEVYRRGNLRERPVQRNTARYNGIHRIQEGVMTSSCFACRRSSVRHR